MESVFISYSHKDEAWKDRVKKHLHVLEKENLLNLAEALHLSGAKTEAEKM